MIAKLSKFLTLALATGFGIGLYAPFAPGTFGSLPGLVLVFLMSYLSVPLQIGFCVLLALFAVFVCGKAEKYLGIKDDGRIAADEWMLLPIAFIAIPLFELPLYKIILMFGVVRLIDILKPWPCKSLQSIKGGLGIVIDDFVANIYSLVVNIFIWKTTLLG
ncbi:MAG: phosphatidylglycerophosphatase A [Kiritimatiellae bacterium]|nr:phosphatidylglycerophosphatase A [Kiritimatiellia bacterium]